METSTEINVNIADVIARAAESPLGVISLLIIVLGLVAVLLFRNSGGRIRLAAFGMLILGLMLSIWPMWQAYNFENERAKEENRVAELILTCKDEAEVEKHSCRAYDKSGFEGKPSDSCGLRLNSGDGRFFAENEVTVLSQNYRKNGGASAKNAMLARRKEINGVSVVDAFSGPISCTNSRGTGRTCEAKATVQAVSYPDKCHEVVKELRL